MQEFNEALLEYRNTPRQKDGRSPAQIINGHSNRTLLPAHPKHFEPEAQPSPEDTEKKLRSALKKKQKDYDANAKDLPELQEGTRVRVQNQQGREPWNKIGIVSKVLPHRKYEITIGNAVLVLVRNRRYLRPIPDEKKTLTFGKNQEHFVEKLPRSCHGDLEPRRSERGNKGKAPSRYGT